jgi:hypothetical protein
VIKIIEKVDFYVGMIISGLCGGIGSALGAYVVNRAVIKHIETLEKRIKRTDANLFNFGSNPNNPQMALKRL